MGIGNADGKGSKSDVTVKNITQNQAGLLNNQVMGIGNAANGGSSKVTATNVTQNQAGLLNSQGLNIGNAK